MCLLLYPLNEVRNANAVIARIKIFDFYSPISMENIWAITMAVIPLSQMELTGGLGVACTTHWNGLRWKFANDASGHDEV